MRNRVFIAGVGAITAIGNNTTACLTSLENEQAGIGDITHLKTIHRNQLPVDELKLTNQQLAKLSGL